MTNTMAITSLKGALFLRISGTLLTFMSTQHCYDIRYLRSILHDEREYPNPHSFQPERFLTPDGTLRGDVLDPLKFAFGFGRR